MFPPGTTDFGCFCSCVRAVSWVAVAGLRSRGSSYLFRASLNSAHVLQMTSVTSLVAISKVAGVVLPKNGTHLKSHEIFLKKNAGLGLFLDLLEDRNLEHSCFSVLLCKLRRLKSCFVLGAGICLSHGEQKAQPFEKQQSCSVKVPSQC